MPSIKELLEDFKTPMIICPEGHFEEAIKLIKIIDTERGVLQYTNKYGEIHYIPNWGDGVNFSLIAECDNEEPEIMQVLDDIQTQLDDIHELLYEMVEETNEDE
jgi:hypothetical protein